MDFKPGGLSFLSDIGGKVEEMGRMGVKSYGMWKWLRFATERNSK